MESLIISFISANVNHSLNEICQFTNKFDCNIDYKNLIKLKDYANIILNISANWSVLAKIEASLPQLARNLDTNISHYRVKEDKEEYPNLPYSFNVVSIYQSNIINEVINFFLEQEINIQDFNACTEENGDYKTLFINGKIHLPLDISPSILREQFNLLCDDLAIDGMIEPCKYKKG